MTIKARKEKLPRVFQLQGSVHSDGFHKNMRNEMPLFYTLIRKEKDGDEMVR